MAPPVRFPSGVTTVGKTNPLSSFKAPDPAGMHMLWNEWDHYTAADWIVTAVGTSPIALGDGDGGVLTVTTGGTEDDGDWVQTPVEGFLLEDGKKAWLKARVMFDVVDEMDFIFGLHSTSTTPQAAQSRFLFESVDGSAAVYFNNDDNTTDTDSSTVATLVADTWIELAAEWDGKGTVKLFADGVHITSLTSLDVPTEELALGFGCITGAAAAVVMSVDYILAAKER